MMPMANQFALERSAYTHRHDAIALRFKLDIRIERLEEEMALRLREHFPATSLSFDSGEQFFPDEFDDDRQLGRYSVRADVAIQDPSIESYLVSLDFHASVLSGCDCREIARDRARVRP